MINTARVTLLLLSALIFAGGVIGFVKGKSKVSLIVAGISALLLDACFALSLNDHKLGLTLADIVCFLLVIVGTMRFAKTKKFMPGGFILVLSALSTIIVSIAICQI